MPQPLWAVKDRLDMKLKETSIHVRRALSAWKLSLSSSKGKLNPTVGSPLGCIPGSYGLAHPLMHPSAELTQRP